MAKWKKNESACINLKSKKLNSEWEYIFLSVQLAEPHRIVSIAHWWLRGAESKGIKLFH